MLVGDETHRVKPGNIGGTVPFVTRSCHARRAETLSAVPEVSVVMPAYNAAPYLDEAVQSILGQTFGDFEFIIIDDGSADATPSILQRYAALDSRIRLYRQGNRGMISALNRGCRMARGQYIARMDADDVSLPQRLEKQLAYLERHPHVGVLGTWIHNVDENGSMKGSWRPPTNPKMLKWTNFFGVCVTHSTVLMRRGVLEQLSFYRPDAFHGEDVDLWLRASSITEFGNVPEILNKYRVWNASTHQRGLQLRREVHVRLLARYIRDSLRIEAPTEAVAGLRQTRVGPPPENLGQIEATAKLIQTLYHEFARNNCLTTAERKEISWDAAKRIAALAMHASRFDKRSAAALLLQAVALNRRLLSPSAVVKGLGRSFKRGAEAKSRGPSEARTDKAVL